MNFLVHLYLSDPDPLCRLGNLMGDFVKGRLDRHDYTPRLMLGLRQHRAVDRFALAHKTIRSSKARIEDRFGHLKGILVDIFYDHFLAKNWRAWAEGSLSVFAREAYRLLNRHQDLIPGMYRPVVKFMINQDWLYAYRRPEVIEQVLVRMATRLKRPNLLAQGYAELTRCGQAMEPDCRLFLQAARSMLDEEPHHGKGNTSHD